ncbi:MAG: tRNA adenosine(34) deaminase TadA [Candidatus Aminicenantes bacterium]|nr:tRNA adenosine(34) deaminase TadA [Candidatus Aminicenantes bacterium]
MSRKKRKLFQDEDFMRLALQEAQKAMNKQEVPVGAVIVTSGKILARAHNQPLRRSDPTAHAEILALRTACRRVKNYRLPEAELYVTLEPCAMCLGAAIQARLKRIIYAASDPKAGAVKSVLTFPWEKLNHQPQIEGGLLEKEAASLLKAFFQARRQKKKEKDDQN